MTRRLVADLRVQDGAIVVVLLAAALVELLLRGEPPSLRWVGPALAVLPLWWRRRAPVALFPLQALGGVLWFDVPLDVMLVAWGVGLYSAGAHSRLRWWSLSVPIVVAALLAAIGIPHHFVFPPVPAWAAALAGGVSMWLVGSTVRDREEALRRGRRTRELGERAAVQEERLRIAGELQDLVAHRVGEMAVQAGAARTLVDTAPDRAEGALRSVEETGRATLGELRRLLDALAAEAEP